MSQQEKEKDGMIVNLLRQLNHYEEASTPPQKVHVKNELSEFQTATSLAPSLSKKLNSSLESLNP